MDGVIACAGPSSSWRTRFCLKGNFHLSRFRSDGGGLQYFDALKQQTKVKGKKWQNRCVSRAPKAIWGHSYRCIFQSASTSCPASPEDDEMHESSDAADVNVKFVLQMECNFGQQFNVIGEDPLLGAWDPSAAVPLQWSDNHVWSTELKVPVGKIYEYKFILSGQNGVIEWQPGPNRTFEVSFETSSPLVVIEPWDLGPLPVSELLGESNIAGDVTKVEGQGTKHVFKEQQKSGKEPEFKTETTVTIEQGFKTQSDTSLDEIHEEVSPAKSDVVCDVAETCCLSSVGSFTNLVIQGSPSELEQDLPHEMEDTSLVGMGPSREFEGKAEHDLEATTMVDDIHLEEASVEHIVEDVNDAESSTITNLLEAATKSVAFAGSVVDAIAEELPFKIDEASVSIKNCSRFEGEDEDNHRTKKTVAGECGVTIEEISITDVGLVATASASSVSPVADLISNMPLFKIKGKSSLKGISREHEVDVNDEVEAEKEMDVDDGMKREIESSVKHISQEVSDVSLVLFLVLQQLEQLVSHLKVL
ncbi:hypothetical protein O6H91_Y511800 [Diphasiastrum complanatum]|nr:hypothetical protein O6H91_Y511800 [Diphasiastrum complanatum]KAJ7195289.1 hypothetical protein O6H91_Y511800 [Diphasiastrum complanatum]